MLIIDTDRGQIKVELYKDDMPATTKHILDPVQQDFFSGTVFHRVEDWVIQGGARPNKQVNTLPLEINKKTRWGKPGQVGMARTTDPDSATSQIFITVKEAEWLNPSAQSQGYALFGQVVEGMDVVKSTKMGEKIKSIKLAEPASVVPPLPSGPPSDS